MACFHHQKKNINLQKLVWALLLGGFLCVSTPLSAQKKRYVFRDIHTPVLKLDSKRRVVVCSPPRCGSTLVYMVLQYLFEKKLEVWNKTNKKVIKLHDFKKCKKFCKKHKETLIVVPIRNPVDSLFSYVIATKGPYSEVRKEMLALTPGYANAYSTMHDFIRKFPSRRVLVC